MHIDSNPLKRSLDVLPDGPIKRQKIESGEKYIDLTPALGISSYSHLHLNSIDPLSKLSFAELIQQTGLQAYVLALAVSEQGKFHYMDAVHVQKDNLSFLAYKVERVYYFTLLPGAASLNYLACQPKAEACPPLLAAIIKGNDIGQTCYELATEYFHTGCLEEANRLYGLASQHGHLLGQYMQCKMCSAKQQAEQLIALSAKIHPHLPIFASLLQLILADADRGVQLAEFLHGKLLSAGFGMERNQARAFEKFANLAEQGYVPAQFEKANCLMNNSEKSITKQTVILHLLAEASNQNYSPAQFTLGKIKLLEHALQDIPRGVELIKMAAAQGFLEAKSWIIEHKLIGQYLPLNPAAAFEELAQPEDAEQQFLLARCYIEGLGTAKDVVKGVKLCYLAAKERNGRALHLLGKCKAQGLGLTQDKQGAIKCYLAAAKQKYLPAYSDVGRCYQHGIGTPINLELAVHNYQAGAQRNCPIAQRLLALCLLGGLGISKDETVALGWLMKASAKNDAVATNELGYCLQHGIGTYQRIEEAVKAYTKAAEQGLPEAEVNLGFCFLKGIGKDMHLYRAFTLFEQAAAKGLAEAEYNLALCKEHGWGTAKDSLAAQVLYEKAAKKNHLLAKIRLASIH